MNIERVGVVGCGQMGHGIVQVTAQAGYDVVVREVSDRALEKGLGNIARHLARSVEKGRLEQSAAAVPWACGGRGGTMRRILAITAVVAVGAALVLAAVRAAPVRLIPAHRDATPPASAAKDAYVALPLRFEPNVGQADDGVMFLSQGHGYTMLLTRTGAVLKLGKPAAPNRSASTWWPPPPRSHRRSRSRPCSPPTPR